MFLETDIMRPLKHKDIIIQKIKNAYSTLAWKKNKIRTGGSLWKVLAKKNKTLGNPNILVTYQEKNGNIANFKIIDTVNKNFILII